MANKSWLRWLVSVKTTIVFCLLLLAQQATSQTFTARERELILERHRQRLDQEALAVFEEKIKGGTGREIRSNIGGSSGVSGTGSENNFHLLMNYDGLYDQLALGNVSWNSFSCGDSNLLGSPLLGIDYRRHADRHYLLCFSADVLLLRTFTLYGSGLHLDPTFSLRRLRDDEQGSSIKQAIFYTHYNTGRLFIAALTRGGGGLLYSLLTYQVELPEIEGSPTPTSFVSKIVPRGLGHRFALGETVVAIDSLHYGLNRHKLVAMLTGKQFEVVQSDSLPIIKVTMPGASLLKTLRITTQGFLLAANSTHWGAFRVEETNSELVALYRSYSPIVDLHTMAFGDSTRAQYVAVAAHYHQMIYRWDSEADSFKGSAKMRLPGVYKMNVLGVSYGREDVLFYFDQQQDKANSNETLIYGFDSNSGAFVKMTAVVRPLPGLPVNLHFVPSYGVHFSQRHTAFEIKVANGAGIPNQQHPLYLFAYQTYIEDNSFTAQNERKQNRRRDPRPDIAGLQLIAERQTMEHKLNNMLQATNNFERTETLSKKPVNVTFAFDVRLQSRIITKRLVVESPANNVGNGPSFPRSQWIINRRRFNGSDILVRLDKLRQLLPVVSDRATKMKQELDTEVVYRSSHHITLTGFKEFVNPVVAVPSIEAGRAFVNLYRREYVGDLLSKMYRLSGASNVLIGGTKLLAVNSVVQSFLKLGRLNGARLEDFLYGSLPQEVHTQLWYRRLTVDQLQLATDQLAANVSLSKAVFINQAGNPPVTIANRAIFSSLDVAHLTVDTIDHLPMSRLPGMVLRKSVRKGVQTFRMPTRMASLHVTAGELTTDVLNGVNASSVFANLVRRSGVVHLQAPVRIVGDAQIRTLLTDGRLNGVRVPEDLLDGFSDQTIHGVKKFSQMTLKNLQTAELNGLKVPSDIITLSRDEVVPGRLLVDALRVGGSLQVDGGLVDGINITHLDQRYIARLANHYHNLTFYKPVRVKMLKVVGGHSNGVNLEDAYADAVFNNSRTPVHIPGTKVISSMLRCADLVATGGINGQSLNDYATTFTPASFSRPVTFWGPVQFGEVAIRRGGSLDGVLVEDLLSSVSQHRKQQHVLHGRKHFTKVVTADRLVVLGTINGIAPADFMLYSTEQNITGRKFFSKASFGRLVSETASATNLQLSGSLNGANFSAMTNQQIVWLRRERYLDAPALYCANCSAVNVQSTYVNGRNWTYFTEHYLSKSRPQTVSGKMLFKGVQSFVELSTRTGVVGGINMAEIREQAVTLHGHNILRNRVVLHDDLVLAAGHLNAQTYNDININEFYRKAVHVNQTDLVTIHGRTIFGRGFDLHADMTADLLNGVAPERLLMTKTGNYTIKSDVTFSGRVVTSGNVRVNAALNGVDLARMDAGVLKVNDRGQVEGSVNFLSPVEIQEVAVQGLVDGIPVHRETILMSNSGAGGQTLNRLVLDGGAHFTGDVHVLATINGYAQENLGKIVMAKSGERQVINASKTFARDIEAVEIRQLAGDVHIRVLNGVPLADFERNAVYSSSSSMNNNRTFKAAQHFTENVTLATRQVAVNGVVNGINLLAEVIRLDIANQTVTGVKTFERVNLNDDIDVHGHVNALDLPLIQKSVLYTVGQQEVPNTVVFKAPLYLTADSQVDTLNRLPPSSLLTLSGEQQNIPGELRFGTVKVGSVTSSTVNGINLTEVAQHVLYKNSPQPQRVQGTLVVNKARFDDDVALKYHLNRVDLNVAVDAAKANLQEQFNVEQVAKTISSSEVQLKQHRTRIEYASFAIEYLTPSRLQVDHLHKQSKTLAASKFDYLFGQQVGQAVYASLMTFQARITATISITTTYQPFTFRGHSYVAVIESPSDRHLGLIRSTLRLLAIAWETRTRQPAFEEVYAEVFPSSFKTLVFSMDESLYIVYGNTVAASCASNRNSTSYLKRLSVSATTGHFSSSSQAVIVQQFTSEQEVRSVGHYSDGQDYHYLVFSSQQVALDERQLTIYKRFGVALDGQASCHFEAVQRIEAASGQLMAIFKFGLPGLLEQYMLVLSKRELTLWKQKGVYGFSQRWTARASYLPDASDDESEQVLTPFLLNSANNSTQQQYQRLFFKTPSCPLPFFEAVLTGRFNGLQLFYDDFY